MVPNPMVQLELENLAEPPEEPEPEAVRPRRSRAKDAAPRNARPRWRTRLRFALGVTALVGGVVLAAFGVYHVDQFLARHPRFTLPRLDGSTDWADHFRIEGVRHASRREIIRIFAQDFGRSIYLVPLAERRQELLTLDWVREAWVLRRWPDSLLVRIRERVPVAFVLLPPAKSGPGQESSPTELVLIDSEGVILTPPPQGKFELPVLLGVSRAQPRHMRRERVALMLELLEELEPFAGQISEIDVSNPDDLAITQTVEGRALRLLLGRDRFLTRVRNFVQHYPEIARRLPAATKFDLRLDDRITAVEEKSDER